MELTEGNLERVDKIFGTDYIQENLIFKFIGFVGNDFL
jgi:predicted methyltransferase MtxX (methanogen marker protein 4)